MDKIINNINKVRLSILDIERKLSHEKNQLGSLLNNICGIERELSHARNQLGILLNKLEMKVHEKISYQCSICEKTYKTKSEANDCLEDCKAEMIISEVEIYHLDKERGVEVIVIEYQCPICKEHYETENEAINCLEEHQSEMKVEELEW